MPDRDEGSRQLPQLPDPRGRQAWPYPPRLKTQILAYFDTHGVSNGGTEAINLIIEKVRRLAHGFKTLIIIACGSCSRLIDAARTEAATPMLNPEDPFCT
jgi:hypothetical protein